MGKFQPGHKLSKGRPLGSTNKRRSIELLCEEMGFDPFALLIETAKDPCAKDQFFALKELCQYLEPKKKSLEHSGEIANPYMNKSIEELEELVKEKLNSK